MSLRRTVSILWGMTILASVLVYAQGAGLLSPQITASTGRPELEALARAYSDRILEVEFHDGEWTILMDGKRYYWAQGRILPEEIRDQWRQYTVFRFYRYPLGGLPPLARLTGEETERLRRMLREAETNPPRRWEGFLETLLRAGSRIEIESRLRTVNFLGFRVKVHERIAPALENVALACDALRKNDPGVAAFFAGLKQMDGYQYREVAGTLTRSYHGYGLAVDLIPKSYGGKQTYWRWSLGTSEEWWAIPHEERWMAPEAVVAAFEDNGFVWGGKWLFFDTMHFEYRPEVFLLARERERT